jgi:amino acid permease
MYACGVVIGRAIYDESAGNDVEVFRLSLDLFRAIPVMTVSFAAHYSGPKLFLELGSDLKKWNRVITYETLSVGIFYALVSLAGYITFGSDIKGDLFDNYDSDDTLILWARLVLALSVTFTIPFSFLSVRRHTANVIYGLDDDFNYPLLRKVVITMLLLALCVLIGLVFPDVEIVISFKGSLLGTPVIYVFPGLFYLKLLQKDRQSGRRSLNGSDEEDDLRKPLNRDFEDSESELTQGNICCGLLKGLHWRDWIGPMILIWFGLITGVISFIMTVLKLVT